MSKTRKILATLTMVAVATTASVSAVSSAQAHWTGTPHLHYIPPPPPPPPAPPHKHGGLKPGEAAALGAVGGLLVGTIIANSSKQQVQPAPSTGLPMQHYVWCDAKYKTYVIATNTYTGYDMKPHYCVSPYVY